MATLNSSYQYIGRSNGVGCKAGYNYYILLYAKTSGDVSSGKHTVTVLQRMACEVNSTFYGWSTSGSITANDISITSWSWKNIPGAAWNSSPITEGGVTYKQWVDLNEGYAVIDVGYGVTKNIAISSSWVMKASNSENWFPYTGVYANVNVTVTLPMIATASTITSASNVTLGNKCAVKWTPMAAAFYYKMGFQLGDWKYSTEVVHPNQTSEYTYTGFTIPLEVANQIPDDPNGTMYVYLHTFTDSAGKNQIGDTSSATFKVTVPNDAATKPTVSMELSAVHSLQDKFSGLYIQGKSKVKVNPSAKGKYGASIRSFSVNVGGVSYGEAEGYTSGYLNTYGTTNVTCYATDSRGYTGDTPLEISVIAYRDPTLENVSAVRCDKNGNESESGTYLKIKAKRSYVPVVSSGKQKNFCQIRYRYKAEGNSSYGAWATILAADNLGSDEVVTGPLLNGNLLITTSYRVEVQALDDIGGTALSTIIIPTDRVYWHRDGARNALGLGKYNEKDNALDSAWDIHMNGKKVTGLPTPTSSTDAVPLGFLKDYVVEQGTSGIWAYRKWNGGFAELWCSLDATYQNGSVLASAEVAYPFTMIDAVCGVGSLNSYGGNAAGALPWNLKLAYGPTACRIWVHNSGGNFTSASTVSGSAYIVGRWK